MGEQNPCGQQDAIIFVKGLGSRIDQSVDGIALRISRELDRNAQTVAAKFSIEPGGRDEDFQDNAGGIQKARMRTIVRKVGDVEGPHVDIYQMDYDQTLRKDYENNNLLVQSLRLLGGWIMLIIPLLGAFSLKRKAKTFVEKLQLAFVAVIAILLAAYTGIVLVAAVEAVVQSPQVIEAARSLAQPAATATPAPSATPLPQSTPAEVAAAQPAAPQVSQGGAAGRGLSLAMLLVLLVAVVEVFVPNLKDKISNSAVDYLSAVDYINSGGRRNVVAGQLADLLEYVAEKGCYRNIYLVSFSFGSLISIDNLFPRGRPASRRFELVHTLVTIGCPFDVVRLLWPNYFKGRTVESNVPVKWYNIYSPIDILASNFRDDNTIDQAEKNVESTNRTTPPPAPENIVYTGGIDPQQYKGISWLGLIGLRSHNIYWENQAESEVSCFQDIVLRLYTGDAMLA